MESNVIQMDKVGRIVLPKAVRDRFGLQAGDSLQVSILPEGVELRPTKPGPRVEEVDGVLVLKGLSVSGSVPELIRRDREARLSDLSFEGLGKA